MIGSKENRELKKKAAESEPAWEGAGAKEGVEVWRVEKFKINRWPENQYGNFFTGDSYIVLDTYKPDPDAPKLAYDVHFWLGSKSSQDERGTAAYKTVELDDFLGDLPVQFRETEGHESPCFLKLFDPMTLMEGGIASGFNHVKPEEYKTKLFQIQGTKRANIKSCEVECEGKSLNNGDVFVLDAGLNIIQWNGKTASIWEKRKGGEVMRGINDSRNGKAKTSVIEYDDDCEEFWSALGGKVEVAEAEAKKKSFIDDDGEFSFGGGGAKKAAAEEAGVEAYAPATEEESWDERATKKLFKCTMDDDELQFILAVGADEKLTKDKLENDAIMLLDVCDEDQEHHVYVHVGQDCDSSHWAKSIEYGCQYLKDFAFEPVHCVVRIVQGKSRRDIGFAKAFE